MERLGEREVVKKLGYQLPKRLDSDNPINLLRLIVNLEWYQPHTTPVTSTWTDDYLTREGEGHKAMGDCLRDKTISWKAPMVGNLKDLWDWERRWEENHSQIRIYTAQRT